MALRKRCFFDVDIDGVPAGRIIFELYSDVCPKTCENFRTLCTGEAGVGKTTEKPLHYRGVKFHRVIKDFMIQGGDFSAGNGTGGESIYGGQFEDESFDIQHEKPFLLSMANRGKDTNGSQFFVTTQPAPHLDGKHVVFGRVVSGQELVLAIEDLPVDNKSRPLQPAVISNCGELIQVAKGKEKKKKKKKIEESESTGSASETEVKKKKKKEKKHKKRKKVESSDEEGEVKDDDVDEPKVNTKETQGVFRPHPLASVSSINPEEIPAVPQNRFLYRAAGPEKGAAGKDRRDLGRDGRDRDRPRATVRAYTKSGRKVKGRGSLRYRTPSRSRSRSVTPPHWRQAQRKTIPFEQFKRKTEERRQRSEEEMGGPDGRDQQLDERRRRRQERHRQREEEADFGIPGGRMRENGERQRRRDRDDGSGKSFREHESWKGRDLRDRLKGRKDDRNSAEDKEDTKPQEKPRGRWEESDRDSGNEDHSESEDKKDEKEEKEDGGELDETALDYEAMDNEEEEEEEEQKPVNGRIDQEEPLDRNPSPTEEIATDEVATKNGEKIIEKGTKKRSSSKEEPSENKEEKEKQTERQRRSAERAREKERRNRSRSRDRRGRNVRNRSRERRERSRDRRDGRRDRSRERRDRGHYRSRDRRGGRSRSRDRRDRSRDKKDRSGSKSRRDRSRDRSHERRRDRRRRYSSSDNSSNSD
ncbi:nuclear cyclophilin protein Moca-cyp isoform X2 [Oratosquilla oratoria]|uniref:nuclear cyclophilin protein Moca-cyp isoform X2 n=1 Tax=Oratosquilla oratoria TaxID=337810 RepID=UPI003F75F110